MNLRGLWLDGLTVPAADLRLLDVALWASGGSPLAVHGGIRYTPGQPGLVSPAAAGLAVTVTPFLAVSRRNSTETGGYAVGLDAPATLPLDPASGSFPRRDAVAIVITATDYDVKVISGVAASFPAAPDLSTYGLLLAEILVPAGASTAAQCTITDRRTWLMPASPPSAGAAASADAVPETSTTSTAWHTTAAQLAVPFTAPGSGKVNVTVAGRFWRTQTGGAVSASARIVGPSSYLRDPGTTETFGATGIDYGSASQLQSSVTFPVIGLAPGQEYTAVFVGKVSSASVSGHWADRRVSVSPVAA